MEIATYVVAAILVALAGWAAFRRREPDVFADVVAFERARLALSRDLPGSLPAPLGADPASERRSA